VLENLHSIQKALGSIPNTTKENKGQIWWYTSIIPALERLQEDLEFEVSISYTVRPCLQKQNKNKGLGM
jgi:hypothetical protein